MDASNPIPPPSRTAAVARVGRGLALVATLASCSAEGAPPTAKRAADGRRTAQFDVVGPRVASPARLTSVRITEGMSLNVPVTVGDDGTVFAGTWGVLRMHGSDDRRDWEKLDGQVFAFAPDLSPAWSEPFAPPRVPYCYDHAGRTDEQRCPTGGAGSWLSGTVEGRPTLHGESLYVGRGDGALYALDASTGHERWRARTYNPADPADPDGGGEVIAEPWVGADGTVYFGSYGVGPYETNAVYAIAPDGTERWRYPALEPSATTSFLAALATSPDGSRLYAAGFWRHGGDATSPFPPSITPEDGARSSEPGRLFAFDIARGSGTGDERLLWSVELRDSDGWPVGATSLAVAADGTLFVGGSSASLGYHAVLLAFRDTGGAAAAAWPRTVSVAGDRAAYAMGLALREEEGVTTRVYVTSGNNSAVPGGKLLAVSPGDGAVAWSLDPESVGAGGSVNGVALDRTGVAYVSTRGRDGSGGEVLAVDGEGSVLFTLPLDQPLDLARPILGPRGDLYVGGSLRDNPCPLLVPVELGLCPDGPRDPALYVLSAR